MKTKKRAETKRSETQLLHDIWEEHKGKAVKAEDEEFISFDNVTFDRLGIPYGELESPGNFRTFPHQDGHDRVYWVRRFGRDRVRLFRRFHSK